MFRLKMIAIIRPNYRNTERGREAGIYNCISGSNTVVKYKAVIHTHLTSFHGKLDSCKFSFSE